MNLERFTQLNAIRETLYKELKHPLDILTPEGVEKLLNGIMEVNKLINEEVYRGLDNAYKL